MLEREYTPENIVPYRVKRSPEEHGEIAQVLSAHIREAHRILATYQPDTDMVDGIITEQKAKALSSDDNNFDPVTECLNKALDAAHTPGNAIGKVFPHPIDYLTAAKTIESEQRKHPNEKIQVLPELVLFYLGIAQYSLSTINHLHTERHRKEASTLFSLSLDIEQERKALDEVRHTPARSA